MATDYCRSVLQICIAQISQNLGWTSAHSTPLELLTDILERYIFEVGKTAHRYSEQFGRPEPNLADLGLAFNQLGINVSELEDYVKHIDSIPFAKEVVSFPADKENNLQFPNPNARELQVRDEKYEDHLPLLSPENQVEEPAPPVNEEAVPATPNTPVQTESSPVVGEKRALTSPDGPVFKKARLSNSLLPEEAGHSQYEMRSVVVLQDGTLTPTRHGKLPDSRTPPQGLPPTVMLRNDLNSNKSLKKVKLIPVGGKKKEKHSGDEKEISLHIDSDYEGSKGGILHREQKKGHKHRLPSLQLKQKYTKTGKPKGRPRTISPGRSKSPKGMTEKPKKIILIPKSEKAESSNDISEKESPSKITTKLSGDPFKNDSELVGPNSGDSSADDSQEPRLVIAEKDIKSETKKKEEEAKQARIQAIIDSVVSCSGSKKTPSENKDSLKNEGEKSRSERIDESIIEVIRRAAKEEADMAASKKHHLATPPKDPGSVTKGTPGRKPKQKGVSPQKKNTVKDKLKDKISKQKIQEQPLDLSMKEKPVDPKYDKEEFRVFDFTEESETPPEPKLERQKSTPKASPQFSPRLSALSSPGVHSGLPPPFPPPFAHTSPTASQTLPPVPATPPASIPPPAPPPAPVPVSAPAPKPTEPPSVPLKAEAITPSVPEIVKKEAVEVELQPPILKCETMQEPVLTDEPVNDLPPILPLKIDLAKDKKEEKREKSKDKDRKDKEHRKDKERKKKKKKDKDKDRDREKKRDRDRSDKEERPKDYNPPIRLNIKLGGTPVSSMEPFKPSPSQDASPPVGKSDSTPHRPEIPKIVIKNLISPYGHDGKKKDITIQKELFSINKEPSSADKEPVCEKSDKESGQAKDSSANKKATVIQVKDLVSTRSVTSPVEEKDISNNQTDKSISDESSVSKEVVKQEIPTKEKDIESVVKELVASKEPSMKEENLPKEKEGQAEEIVVNKETEDTKEDVTPKDEGIETTEPKETVDVEEVPNKPQVSSPLKKEKKVEEKSTPPPRRDSTRGRGAHLRKGALLKKEKEMASKKDVQVQNKEEESVDKPVSPKKESEDEEPLSEPSPVRRQSSTSATSSVIPPMPPPSSKFSQQQKAAPLPNPLVMLAQSTSQKASPKAAAKQTTPKRGQTLSRAAAAAKSTTPPKASQVSPHKAVAAATPPPSETKAVKKEPVKSPRPRGRPPLHPKPVLSSPISSPTEPVAPPSSSQDSSSDTAATSSSTIPPPPPPSKGKSVQRTVVAETVGTIVDESGQKIWICPGCKLPDDGSAMIGCDICDEWYHWPCVNITEEPAENEPWYCPKCMGGTKKQRGRKRGRKKKGT